jgi:hypothetical protein
MLARAGRVRNADEFRRARAAVTAPRRELASDYSWTLEDIAAVRAMQMRGDFQRPVRMAEAMRRDDALYVAYANRLAPQSAIATQLVAAGGTRGEAVKRKADTGVIIPRSVLKGIHGTLANHGVAIGHIDQVVDEDGTRIDFHLTEWPLEFVKWNASTERLETRVRDGAGQVPITHGDGEWVIFRKFSDRPWLQEACIVPASLVWAAHGNGIKDWAGASVSHGLAKIMGELPAGMSLIGEDGALTPEAQAFLDMMQDLVSGESGAGIRPAGAKTDVLANASTAWQVFAELIMSREKAAARIYLGTDGTLGSQGGAPGVDIAELFGVATTIVQGDFEAIEQGVNTGVLEPWCAVNEGDSRLAPKLRYLMPDPDAEKRSEHERAKRERLFATLREMREQQMAIDQPTVDALAHAYGVHPVPVLAAQENRSTPIALAPTDIARVVKVREARASQGLPPLNDPRDDLFISELEEQAKADAAAAAAPPPVPEAP